METSVLATMKMCAKILAGNQVSVMVKRKLRWIYLKIENMVNSDDLLCQEIIKVVRNINSARSETGVKGPNSSL